MKATQIQIALDLAANLKRSPAMFIDPQTAKDAIVALFDGISSSQCFYNALVKGRETFCLTSDDRLAPDTILFWGEQARLAGVETGKVDDSFRMAMRWRTNPGAKTPD